METVEVRHSLISNRSINNLLHSYEIGSIISCRFLIRGLNDTYLVISDQNQYIFRVYRKGWREKSDVSYEIDAINHLSSFGCNVSRPIIRKDGEWISEIPAPEGMRYGVLFTFSPGDRPEITSENCYLIGQTLATIHKTTDSFPFKSDNNRSFELNLEHLIDEPMSLITPEMQKFIPSSQMTLFNQIIKDIKKDLFGKELEFGFCHGDFHNFNMHILEQKLEAFDFDCCSTGYRSYDLAVFWWNLKQNYPHLENPCWDEFLNGYSSEKSISSTNLNVLRKFVSLRRIWFLGILLENDDVWGTHWINNHNLEGVLTKIKQDAEQF
jgi:Ser/Thr protein kinase RdoA (MazF antagonist)